jgi:hypothetical protein
MGTDWRDYDNDGRPDIVLTALAGETYPLFRGQSDGGLRDATHASGLAALTVRHSGWGVGWVDFDNDGWKDLFTANSHVNDRIEQFEAFRYKEPNSVFRNLGNGRFADDSGSFEAAVRAHRGAAFADFDNDGRIDVVVSALGEPAELWRNTTADAAPRHWLRVIPRGARSNRDGIGALVTVGKQSNLMSTAVSYSSSSHYGVPFGLGGDKGPLTLTVHWPSGAIQRIDGVAPDRVLTVTEPAAP